MISYGWNRIIAKFERNLYLCQHLFGVLLRLLKNVRFLCLISKRVYCSAKFCHSNCFYISKLSVLSIPWRTLQRINSGDVMFKFLLRKFSIFPCLSNYTSVMIDVHVLWFKFKIYWKGHRIFRTYSVGFYQYILENLWNE